MSGWLGSGLEHQQRLDGQDHDRIGPSEAVKRMIKNIVLCVVTIATVGIAMELAVRVLFADITSTADTGSYFAQRWLGSEAVDHNRFGFRDEEFQTTPAESVYRLVLLGDSYTYGLGIAEEDRVSERLERMLNQSSAKYEVLNFGELGADYPTLTDNLKLIVNEASPDFVLYQWYLNDHTDPAVKRNYAPPLGLWFHYELSSISALYFVANQVWVEALYKTGLVEPPSSYWRQYYSDPESPIAENARDRLQTLISTSTEAGIPIGMVLWPSTWDEAEGLDRGDFIMERVLASCRERQLVCLDLRPALRNAASRGSLRVNQFDGHPSALANQAAAEAIQSEFAAAWCLEHHLKTAKNPQSEAACPAT